jgi:hypothetical protein
MAEKNRFWANGSDSDSDSVEDEDIDTDVKTNVAKMNKWVVESDSDSDDDKGRVVRSAKEKHMDALEDHITTVRNGLKNNDWDRVQEGYKSLNEAVEKVRKATGISFPVSFVRTIVAIDTAVEGVTKEDTRKMTKSGARAYTTLKQAMKKTTKVEPLLGEIEKYKKNPVVSDDEDEEDEEEEEDDDEEVHLILFSYNIFCQFSYLLFSLLTHRMTMMMTKMMMKMRRRRKRRKMMTKMMMMKIGNERRLTLFSVAMNTEITFLMFL